MKKNKLIFLDIILLLILLFVLIALFVQDYFGAVTIEQLLFSVQMSEGTSNSVVIEGAKYIIARIIAVYLVLFVICFIITHCF